MDKDLVFFGIVIVCLFIYGLFRGPDKGTKK